jgi:hypothetical protein
VAAAFAGCLGDSQAASIGSDEALAARVAEPPSAALAAAAAAAAAAFAGKHFDVRQLTELADEVLDVGLELPEQQLLRQRLEEGQALQDQITEVLATEGDERYDVHGLRELQQQASTCGLALGGEFAGVPAVAVSASVVVTDQNKEILVELVDKRMLQCGTCCQHA